jgi:exodeoxyribonuclease V alpha subunit
VLADICGAGNHPGYAAPLVSRAREAAGSSLLERGSPRLEMIDTVIELDKSYRFSASSAIARFARAINRGESATATELLAADPGAERSALLLVSASDTDELLSRLERHARARLTYLEYQREPELALQRLDDFRVLCAHRKGPLGVESINRRLEAALERAGVIHKSGEWYPGRPILVTANDHHQRLFNGDVGLILRDASGRLRAFFKEGDGKLRTLSPARLPAHETMFAMSVHKSQGSEFAEVALVLPRPESPLLTRELLYTAVTRARERAVLYGELESVRVGAARPVARASGLGDLLHARPNY